MDDKALAYLDTSDGWALGVGPSIVILDKGRAKSLTTRPCRTTSTRSSSTRRV
jgi:hypothetical protein